MNQEEINHWEYLLNRCDEGGNDDADVYEAEEFCRMMQEKYGKPFKDLIGAIQ